MAPFKINVKDDVIIDKDTNNKHFFQVKEKRKDDVLGEKGEKLEAAELDELLKRFQLVFPFAPVKRGAKDRTFINTVVLHEEGNNSLPFIGWEVQDANDKKGNPVKEIKAAIKNEGLWSTRNFEVKVDDLGLPTEIVEEYVDLGEESTLWYGDMKTTRDGKKRFQVNHFERRE